MSSESFDVVVVGAGTSGANAAYQFARRGRRVLLVERRSVQRGGAHWFNGLLDRHFDRAGLDRPEGAERVAAHATVHMRSADPRVGFTLADSPTVTTNMALLAARLRSLAVAAGTEIADEVARFDVTFDATTGRITSITLRGRDGGAARQIRAALFVDAGGSRGVLRRHSPHLDRWCPPVSANELCSAADAHFEVSDPAGAREFLARHGAQPGEAVCFVGISGGFSTLNMTIAADLAGVSVLVGCLANGRYGTGPNMIRSLRRREQWIGEPSHFGAGAIPLRRPFARFTAPGLAAVGDAACHVFPAHGSGVGSGLIAGSMLAEGVGAADDPGDEALLWCRYQAAFQRELGGLHLAHDAVRRASTALGEVGVDALLRSGVLSETTTRAGLDQRWVTPEPRELVRAGAALTRVPRAAAVMLPALAKGRLLMKLGDTYPSAIDLNALATWDRRAQHLLGTLPA